MREDILVFPEVEIELNSKNYDLDCEVSAPTHRCFLSFIFDALEEAFY